RGLEGRVLALRERRRGRERDEVRDVAREAVREVDRVVAARNADVDVLPEHGELLREIAVEVRDVREALARGDPPLAPLVERMRPAPRDGEVELVRRADDGVSRACQLGDEIAVLSV